MSETTSTPITDPASDAHGQPGTPPRGVRIVHLVFGVLFLGLTAIWALGATDTIQMDVNVAVILPVVLILAGVAGLAAMIANAGRSRRARDAYDS